MSTVTLIDAPQGVDSKIAFMARVSSENQHNPNYVGLIRYLIREKHWSPFEMCNITIEIETEKDIGIQLLRHKNLNLQEFSQRYADCSGMKAPLRECRLQDEKNRQNSLPCEDSNLNNWWEGAQEFIQSKAFELYEQALEAGVAKEVARSILPIGLTKTNIYFNADIRSWLFYCLSRSHISTQKEHREVSEKVFDILFQVAPDTTEAFIREMILPKRAEYDLEELINIITG